MSTGVEIAADGAAMYAPTEFEAVYRANIAAVTGFFARRCSEVQMVADLTSETFVEALTSFETFDVRKGSARAWVFGVARRV